MNKLLHIKTPNSVNQRGAAILLTVVLLLIMVTLVTLYTGKIQLFEHQILVNTQNQKWAQASAKAGLNRGLAMLNINKMWSGVDVLGNLDNNSTFTISAISEDISANRKLITMTAQGFSADNLAKASVTEQLLVYPILFNSPPSPLMVKQGVSDDGEFEVVSNPDGLGIDSPLSLWSDTYISLSATKHHSCILIDFNDGNCAINAYSDYSNKLADIADESFSFPADLVSYLFNIPSTNWTYLQQQSDFVFADCDGLGIDTWGVVWVNGDCEVSASTQIGSVSEPIILVVFDGNINFHADVVMYGLLFSFQPRVSIRVLDINMHTNSAVFGAVITNFQLGIKGGVTRVVYQADVMQKLQESKKLQRVARVPGSWHDF